MFYEMTQQASQAIFQWGRPTTTPEYGKPVLRRQDWHDPLTELAFKIQDLAIVRDENGEETWIDEQDIPINKIIPYATELSEKCKGHSPDVDILQRQLDGWINGGKKHGRAYNIKALTFQICGVLTDPRPDTKQNEDLEF